MSFMTEGGSGTPVPDLSIEVDDLDAVLARVKKAKLLVEYGPASEPWGVRRFFVRDPVRQAREHHRSRGPSCRPWGRPDGGPAALRSVRGRRHGDVAGYARWLRPARRAVATIRY
jgi:hypothetical protein